MSRSDQPQFNIIVSVSASGMMLSPVLLGELIFEVVFPAE